MTLDEAITAQTEMLDIVYNAKSPERSSALRLGIEALKRVKAQHEWALRHDVIYKALPGETLQ